MWLFRAPFPAKWSGSFALDAMHHVASASLTHAREGTDPERRRGPRDKGPREHLASETCIWRHGDCGWPWVSVHGLVSCQMGTITCDGEALRVRNSLRNRGISGEEDRGTGISPEEPSLSPMYNLKKYVPPFSERRGGGQGIFSYLIWFLFSSQHPRLERSFFLRHWPRCSVLHLFVGAEKLILSNCKYHVGLFILQGISFLFHLFLFLQRNAF